MKHPQVPESGVSEVVGEMLMIGLVIILIAVFSAIFFNLVPATREPGISVRISADGQDITLWHKGGDWVRTEDLTVITGNESYRFSFTNESDNFVLVPEKPVFDLGSSITVHVGNIKGNETVRLVTPRTVLFTGKVAP